MATIQANLTPTSNQSPVVVNIPAYELSGHAWVSRYPTSVSVDDCISPFKESLSLFIEAMRNAGATVSIAATYRPVERAYLMHWCWKIVNSATNSANIPAMAGVNINWNHGNPNSSRIAAQEMVNGYSMQNLQTAPALNSKHTQRLAVDMSISWTGNLSIVDRNGNAVTIETAPRSGMNPDLHVIGASFGVIKYNGSGIDRPHWSNTGN